MATLTNREIEYCKEFINSKGKIADIAKNLGIKLSTAKTHNLHVFEKLLIDNRAELMHFLLTNSDWMRIGWELKCLENQT